MEVDRGRSCYAYGELRHMAQCCRNRGQGGRVVKGRRLEYRGRRERNQEYMDNLKEEENLEFLN